jgi:protein O-mannosyl-transferase
MPAKQIVHRSQSAFHWPSIGRDRLIGSALIAALVLVTYWPAVGGSWILDDELLVSNNQLVHAPDGLYRMWFSSEPTDYWPLTTTTFWLEWRLWGDNPACFHVVNLALHIVDCLLLWQILTRLKIPGAFLATLVFAAHPVNVESVAWISQRKNVLAMLFYLLSVLWYLKADENRLFLKRWYWLSLMACLLAMLSKGSVAVLPLILLLLAWWRRPLTKSDYARIAPFLLICGLLTCVNIWFQTHGAETVFRKISAIDRILGAAGVVWFYLAKAVLPVQLRFFYPQWEISANNFLWWLPLAAAIGVTLLLWSRRKSAWGRPSFAAWLYFCICLIPVMGFTDVGYMQYSLVADHYQHLAIIGPIALAAAAWSVWNRRSQAAQKFWPYAAAIVVVGCLSWGTIEQSDLYRQADALFESSLSYSWLANDNLAKDSIHRGQPEQALAYYRQSLQLNPDNGGTEADMSLALWMLGRDDEALKHAGRAVELNPNSAAAHNQLGLALKHSGQLTAAVEQYREAIRLDGRYAIAFNNLGIALQELGKRDEAIENYQAALQVNPDYADAHNNLGLAFAVQNRMNEALTQYREAVRSDPNLLPAQKNLGLALLSTNRESEAIGHLERYVSTGRPDASVCAALAIAYDMMGRKTEAVTAAERGLTIAKAQGQQALIEQLETWLNANRGTKRGAADPTKTN